MFQLDYVLHLDYYNTPTTLGRKVDLITPLKTDKSSTSLNLPGHCTPVSQVNWGPRLDVRKWLTFCLLVLVYTMSSVVTMHTVTINGHLLAL